MFTLRKETDMAPLIKAAPARLQSRLLRATVLAALVCATALPAAAQVPTLKFMPATATAGLGESLVLDVVLADRPAGQPVAFFDIDVLFDPAVLRFDGLVLGQALGSIAGGQAVNASLPPNLAMGVVNLAVLSLLSDLSAQPLSPLLGQVSFSAIGLGPAGIGFSFSAIETLGGTAMVHAKLDAAVTVVPEPATVWTLVAGVLGLLGLQGLSRRIARAKRDTQATRAAGTTSHGSREPFATPA
jgi:hypothetical protein